MLVVCSKLFKPSSLTRLVSSYSQELRYETSARVATAFKELVSSSEEGGRGELSGYAVPRNELPSVLAIKTLEDRREWKAPWGGNASTHRIRLRIPRLENATSTLIVRTDSRLRRAGLLGLPR